MRLAAAVAAAERKGLRFSSLIKITETDLSHLIGQVCFSVIKERNHNACKI